MGEEPCRRTDRYDPDGGVALILGVTGLVGTELAKSLMRKGWPVYGVARSMPDPIVANNNFMFVQCDLLNPEDVHAKLSPLATKVTHAFWVTWASQHLLHSLQCRHQNVAMMSNTLDALLHPTSAKPSALRHLALQTGVMHYTSLQASPATDTNNDDHQLHYYSEESPRVEVEGGHNFYYALEDLLHQRLAEWRSIGWSVHRPGLLLGASRRACFNFIGSLCVYASVCRHLNLSFRFLGDRRCWEEPYIDFSDARLVTEQQIWASSIQISKKVESRLLWRGEAFNAVNEPVFTWRKIWPILAAKFGIESTGDRIGGGGGEDAMTYSELMADKDGIWEDIVEREGLQRTDIGELANWWFFDSVFRFPGKMMARRGKAESLGFVNIEDVLSSTSVDGALDSIYYWVDRLREERLVP